MKCLRSVVGVVYTDLGISPGMKAGIKRAMNAGVDVEYRTVSEWGVVNEHND